MKGVTKGELKAKMLEYFREIERTGAELVVLENRVPVLRVVPIRRRRSADEVFRPYRDKVRFAGDPVAPTTGEWPQV